MRDAKHSLFVIGAIAIIAMVLSHAFTIGYGVGTERRAKTMLAAQQAKLHTPSHLTIHYERQINGQQDILRLELDTTYRSIGKGAFRYETVLQGGWWLPCFDSGDVFFLCDRREGEIATSPLRGSSQWHAFFVSAYDISRVV